MMPSACCQKTLAKIIKVGTFEAGIVGLDEIVTRLSASEWSDDKELGIQLLAEARKYGNYIAPAVEELYRAALLREFKVFGKKGDLRK